jgi:hypothetical protein
MFGLPPPRHISTLPIASISPSGQLLLPASADMPDRAVTSAAPAAADCPLPAGPDIAIDFGSSRFTRNGPWARRELQA